MCEANPALVAGTNAAFAMGTGDFTWEAWVYFPAGSSYRQIFSTRSSNGASSSQGSLAVNPSNGLTWYTSGFIIDYTTSIGANQWVHVALSRSGTTLRLFANGVQVGSATNSDNLTGNTFSIAANNDGSESFNGYISNLRITKGGALYTSGFTPPTTPLTTTVSSGTVSLLTNFTNAGIIDNAMMNDLETVGNAQISTSVSKWGTGSIYVDGTGDWLFARSNPDITLSGDFTIEGWVYQVSNGTSATLLCIGDSNVTGGIALYLDNTSSPTGPRLTLLYNSAILNGATAAAINTWHHIAAVRSGSTITLFLNGVPQGTVSASTTFTGNLLVGAVLFAGTTYSSNNYIDDLRITKGIARYVQNFTPPTQAFQTS